MRATEYVIQPVNNKLMFQLKLFSEVPLTRLCFDFIESGHCLQTGLVRVMETLQTHNRRVTKLYEGGEWSWRCYVAITDLHLHFSAALD